MGLNTHNLLHLTQCVKDWGPMWAWSCFCFESFNGEIKKTIHGTGNICVQVFWSLLAQKHIETRSSAVESHAIREFIKGQSSSLNEIHSDSVQPCLVKKSYAIKENIQEAIEVQIKDLTTEENIQNFRMAKKVIVNGMIVYSKKCTKVKKRNSYTVTISSRPGQVRMMEIQYFLIHQHTGQVLAVGRHLEVQQQLLPMNTPHIRIVNYAEQQWCVEKAMYIQQILVCFEAEGRLVVADIPNTVEGD